MNTKPSVNLRKQMIEDRISNIASLLNINKDKAFERLVYTLVFNAQYDDPDFDSDVVDGGGDKQIDIIRIEEADGQAIVHIIQVKNSDKYRGTTIVQLRNGLEWVLKYPEEKYKQLPNKDLVMKISEIRELSARLLLKNIKIIVYFVGKAGTNTEISPDFKQEVEEVLSLYKASGEFQDFEFLVWGINELINRSYEIEQTAKQINEDLPIYSLWQVPSYSIYSVEDVKAVICTANGEDIAKLVEKHKSAIFDENVRTYLGSCKKVNAEIFRTCTTDKDADYFWFFNNGITVTCDDFEPVYNANPPFIRIENMQIVNGCQTSVTLAEAWSQGLLNPKTKVLLRVYATNDPDFVDKITFTTNSQNAVSSRDLRSNDILQRDLEKLFASRGYHYERKPGTYSKLKSKDEKARIVSNEKVGQAYLAVVYHLPAVAMSRKSQIWNDEYYNKIYHPDSFEMLLASYLIYNYCAQQRKIMGRDGTKTSTILDEAVLKYGTFHIARILGSYELGEYWHTIDRNRLAEFTERIAENSNVLHKEYDRAIELLKQIASKIAQEDMSQLINIFKSNDIQEEIDKTLRKS